MSVRDFYDELASAAQRVSENQRALGSVGRGGRTSWGGNSLEHRAR